MKAKFLILLLGLLIGLAAAVVFPHFRDRLTPGVLKPAPTEGVVEDKRIEGDRLLLTLVTGDGAVLATFTEKVAEIDLLVAPGDTVGLALDGYRPFVEDPEIQRVVKGAPPEEPTQPMPTVETSAEPRAEASAAPEADAAAEPEAEGAAELQPEGPADTQTPPGDPPGD